MYSPYNPYSTLYSGQMAQQGIFPTQTMQQPIQPAQQPNSPVFLQVGSVKEFDTVTVQPGRQALILAQNEPYMAFKSADQMGMVQTMLYHVEPVTAEQITSPASEYVTRKEFEQFVSSLTVKPSEKAGTKEDAQ